MIASDTHDEILRRLATSVGRGRTFRDEVVQALSALPHFDWTGIYRLEGSMLKLDAFVGALTDHTEIPVGRGVCGSAIADHETKNIADVRAETNYLACSLETRSELVVLIEQDDNILGQIDIDSHQVAAFDGTDERLLSEVSALIAKRWS